MKKAGKRLRGFICIAVVFAIAVFAVLKYNDSLCDNVVLTRYVHEDENLPKSFDGFKILVISDLHNAPFYDDITEHIDKTKPDVVVFSGDMVQLPEASCEAAKEIGIYALEGGARVFSLSGNHEKQNSEYDEIMYELYKEGIIPLDDDRTKFERNGEKLWLMGLEDIGENAVNEDTCRKSAKEIGYLLGDGYNVLVNHRADMYPYIKDEKADLILSGHLHGGIARLPFLGGVFGRGKDEYFPKYDYGVFKEEDSSTMIVSGGCDKNPAKKRYFNPPEVVLVTLRAIW